MTVRFKSLSKLKKYLLGIGALLVLVTIIGTTSSPDKKQLENGKKANSAQHVEGASTTNQLSKSKGSKDPVVQIKYEDQTIAIPFSTLTKEDNNMAKGQSSTTPGAIGEKIVTFKVTYTDGKETARIHHKDKIIKKPIDQITRVGTKNVQAKPANCDPNYAGCVPVASDVDCAASAEDGPVYVGGPIKVTGKDIYSLDHDHDGTACE